MTSLSTTSESLASEPGIKESEGIRRNSGSSQGTRLRRDCAPIARGCGCRLGLLRSESSFNAASKEISQT